MNIPEGMTEDEALSASLDAYEAGTNDSSDDFDAQNESKSDDDALDTDYPNQENEEDAEDDSQDDEMPEEAPKKKKSGVAKILAERNALRKEIAELRAKQDYDEDSVAFVEKTAEARVDALVEEKFFFKENPEAREVENEIKDIAKNMNCAISDAYTFYLAKTDPVKLLSEQERNKMSSAQYRPAGSPSKKQTQSKLEYSDDEFAQMVQAGKVRI